MKDFFNTPGFVSLVLWIRLKMHYVRRCVRCLWHTALDKRAHWWAPISQKCANHKHFLSITQYCTVHTGNFLSCRGWSAWPTWWLLVNNSNNNNSSRVRMYSCEWVGWSIPRIRRLRTRCNSPRAGINTFKSSVSYTVLHNFILLFLF